MFINMVNKVYTVIGGGLYSIFFGGNYVKGTSPGRVGRQGEEEFKP
jgi:hypothetical protein